MASASIGVALRTGMVVRLSNRLGAGFKRLE